MFMHLKILDNSRIEESYSESFQEFRDYTTVDVVVCRIDVYQHIFSYH
jgi:hypothetical protein